MIQLSFIEKIQALLEIVKSSGLFIILFLVSAALIALLVIDFKTNKKVNGKLFIASIVTTFVFAAIREIEAGNPKPFTHVEAQTDKFPSHMVVGK